MTTVDTKACRECGTVLVRRGDERANAYTRRQYCSKTCQQHAYRRFRTGGGQPTIVKPPRQAKATEIDTSWHARGACRRPGVDREIFFGADREQGATERVDAAKAICASCPVKAECGRYALTQPEPYGVWGGMSEGERRDILRRRRGASEDHHRLRSSTDALTASLRAGRTAQTGPSAA